MKTLAIILALTSVSVAQDFKSSGYAIAGASCTDQFKELPAMAKRLGVPSGTVQGGVALTMCDGRTWDLFRLMNAFLDRMDKKVK
jgi:hypothetical protein